MTEQKKIEKRIYTIGHSKHSIEDFIALLQKYQIEVLVYIRSRPYSKRVPQFSKDDLKTPLEANDIEYLFLGKELGGLPNGNKYYGTNGFVSYSRIAESLEFREGISRLENGISRYQVVIMCSEENPVGCHRSLLVGQVLRQQGTAVRHIAQPPIIVPHSELDLLNHRLA